MQIKKTLTSGKNKKNACSYLGSRHYNPRESIWLSVDPLAEKYPAMSPYAYCFNNPINLMDPDGRRIQLTGAQKAAALSELQKAAKNLRISMDGEGNIKAEAIKGATLTKREQNFLRAVEDLSVLGVVNASNNDYASNGDPLIGNQMGVTYNADGTATAYQEINVGALSKMDRINGDAGVSTLHEAQEAYEIGLIAIESKESFGAATWGDSKDKTSAYYRAHNKAIEGGANQSGSVRVFDQNGKEIGSPSNKTNWDKIKQNVKTIDYRTRPNNSNKKYKSFHKIKNKDK